MALSTNSAIDINVPATGAPTTQSVRQNFMTARNEIEALNAAVNAGVAGPTGASGAVGATGPSGASGTPGVSGATGPTGASGASGAGGGGPPVIIQGTAPTGAQATNGNLWYNDNTGQLMLRNAGTWEPLI